MCLIEIKNSPKPVVSCAMSAKACLNNNSIFTQSPLVKKARENILEFLLLNHPLDCPICDQGGECDLQDQSFFFGITKKRFYSFKRFVSDKNIGPIVKTLMTRCIHCTRCVRFASEIAGVGNLGIFGRGLSSEIGTYVTKVFKSELSGNVVDLCPVGALTAKPYPFLGRSWELKSVNSIDFSDGFGTNIQVFLKNNKIVKILPNCDSQSIKESWISDKTRFSFDGMFSPERISQGNFLINDKTSCSKLLQWKDIFKNIVNILYFKDHLNRHFYYTKKLTIVFNANISLEVLNLLVIISKKYNFINLRKIDSASIKNDLDTQFMLNSLADKNEFDKSNLCLLVNINSRFEGTTLNLKLRKRFLKGNFKVASIGSLSNLTFPVQYLGSNINSLKSIVEGTHFFCQELNSSINPIIICGSEIIKRKDSLELVKMIRKLQFLVSKELSVINSLSFLSSTVNEVGLNNLSQFRQFGYTDLSDSMGLYFINTSFLDSNLKKIIQLKTLQLFKNSNNSNNFILEHNNGLVSCLSKQFLTLFSNLNYFNFSNKNFFESSGTYINTTGNFKKNISFIPSIGNSKDDWTILRKFFSCTKSVNFLSNLKSNDKIFFNCENMSNFKNFINFRNYPVKTLTKSSFYFNTKVSAINLDNEVNCYTSKIKIFKTKLKFWLEDFYISGKDLYSAHSSTMVKCSKIYRFESSNFNYF